ncbi:MAG: hypothetical protein WKG07_05040 [Hymenobacter sp.]
MPTALDSISGNYVQVSRLGMPLTNEVISARRAERRAWNAGSALTAWLPLPLARPGHVEANLKNPELGLYLADNAPSERRGAPSRLAKRTTAKP